MTYFVQQPGTPAPPAPGRPIDGDELGRRISDAIEKSLSQGPGSEQAQVAREEVRAAIEQMKAEARVQGIETVRIQPEFGPNFLPPQVADIAIAFFVMMGFIIVGLPLARAFARRMDRRGESAKASDIAPRLDRIEQAVEAIAIEVERVSEGQRYTTKAISELRGLPAANPIGGWPAGAREAERVPAGERRP